MTGKNAFLILFFLALGVPAAGAKEQTKIGYKQASPTMETYKPPVSTQNAYRIQNDGTSENSSELSYDHKPSHQVYQDNDRDGRFGENESALVDSDADGRLGEQEAQLGNENVTINQKVRTLNNMGLGSSLSTFHAAGQTQRSSIYNEKPREPGAMRSLAAATPKQTEPGPEPKASPRARVLVA